MSIRQIIIHDVDPGILDTDIGRDMPGALKQAAKAFAWMIAKPPLVGAAVVLHAVGRGKESHGKFIDVEKVKPLVYIIRIYMIEWLIYSGFMKVGFLQKCGEGQTHDREDLGGNDRDCRQI